MPEDFTEAINQQARSLQPRACIEWSLACIRKLQSKPEPPEQQALDAVEKWLADPSDANRRTAKAASDEAGLRTPAGCVALAVFFSEGSISPADKHDVPPPPDVTAKIAAGGIILAAVKDPANSAERLQTCLKLAPKPKTAAS